MSDAVEAPAPLLEEQLCFALYSTSRAITKVYAGLLEDLGLTYPQYAAMLVLWESDGITVQAIADRLELEGATATPLIQRLEKMDLVRKARSKIDARAQDVFLTETGYAMRAHAIDMPDRLGCALGVSDQDAKALLEGIRSLRNSMAETTNTTK
ncbi:MarR family winged helix-turn-helix transcriptional regulator [Aestuariibius insulae]|uniref:MarR family winged helix-turn-helix transcriptional regulator n=1 Tax=Aestuariibius insulae TaxID=2058287 RepID=UPI00345E415E